MIVSEPVYNPVLLRAALETNNNNKKGATTRNNEKTSQLSYTPNKLDKGVIKESRL